jgi:hypothetical protein
MATARGSSMPQNFKLRHYRMNPALADHLVYETTITASVAAGVLEHASSHNEVNIGGILPTYPIARELILAARELRGQPNPISS